jgi:ferrochelatase
MPPFQSSPEYEHGLPEAMGVLLVNLGSPDAPTKDAVRRYLRQFLSDPRVVEIPRLIWLPILHGYILRTRPAKTAKAYQKIWTEHGSPLLLHCGHVAEAIQEKLSSRLSGAIHVELAMSYGQPSIESALKNLHSQFVRRIVVLPMYPQYSGSTTGSVFEAVSKALARRRWVPELRFVNHYHDANGYIAALTSSIRNYRELHGSGEKLLFSFHGIPEKMLLDGDPYHCQCHKTARLVSESLELADDEWDVSFQSRLGRAKWLQPYTDATLEKWGKERTGIIDVISPGFSVDCLETLEEIEIRYNKLYRDAGGGDLHYVPALNAREDHIGFLSRLIEKNVAGWPESSTDWSVSEAARKLEKSRQRAAAMGADN